MTADTQSPACSEWRPFASEVVAGVSRRDITPPVGIRTANWGAPGRHEIALGVHEALTVTALALIDVDGRPRFIVSADLGWWRQIEDEQSVRLPVMAALGIETEHLMLHLVHTHAGPSTSRSEPAGPGGALVSDYLVDVTRAVVDACQDALATTVPCQITWGRGSCQLATVRDLPCGDLDVVGFNPEMLPDDTVVVGRVTATDGSVVATVVNYACHPTTLAWQNPLLSPDYVGPARRIVEDSTGAPCLFLQGASGDLGPRDQFTGDLDVVERNGRILGHAAMSALEALPKPGTVLRFVGVVESGASLGMWEQQSDSASSVVTSRVVHVPVPLQNLLTAEELRSKWADLEEGPAQERVARAMALRKGYVKGGQASHPVWITQVGDAVIVAHPGEAYSLMQTELRRRHPDRCILVANCTNGPGYMYLPERSAYERQRYQVWQTLMGPGALEAVIDAVDAAITDLPHTRGPQPGGIR
jgi:hypothetical protein